MTPFFVQIKCELGKAYQVANKLAEAEIASEIYSTAGDFDLLVKFYVDAGTDIGHFVNEKVHCIDGIRDTRTTITHPATTTHGRITPQARAAAGIGDDLLRVAVGLESVADITADLARGLN